LFWLGQTLASSAVVILGFLVVRSTNIGERFLSHRFDRKLAEFKHAQEEKIEGLRRTINIAGAAIYDGRHTLRTEGIYLSAPVAKRFKEAFDRSSGAQTERYLVFHRGHRGGHEKSMDVVDTTGDGEIAALQDLVRTTIRRD
jgi:hypothetical protein